LRLFSTDEIHEFNVGDIDIDQDVYTELHKTGQFRSMDSSVDEVGHMIAEYAASHCFWEFNIIRTLPCITHGVCGCSTLSVLP
jgi:hypothetical protein